MDEENTVKTFQEIVEDYQKFNILPEQIPTYENPYQFAQNFKQCSIVEYKNISYSNTSLTTEPCTKK